MLFRSRDGRRGARRSGHPKPRGSPHRAPRTQPSAQRALFKHGGEVVEITDRSFEGLKAYLSQRPEIEGLVFHKFIDGVLHYAKVRQKDFGFAWNLGAEGVRAPRKGKRA